MKLKSCDCWSFYIKRLYLCFKIHNLWWLSWWTKHLRIINFYWSQSLFSAVNQKPMELREPEWCKLLRWPLKICNHHCIALSIHLLLGCCNYWIFQQGLSDKSGSVLWCFLKQEVRMGNIKGPSEFRKKHSMSVTDTSISKKVILSSFRTDVSFSASKHELKATELYFGFFWNFKLKHLTQVTGEWRFTK